ncbi:gamma-glutamylcyclotransferase [Halyomorpha halys]|uniref:gamma-glutamylcyclotransferase n=1 Tax=Halyomorpha halys TaxID=286706 RepID=UPI000D0C7DC9|nr:gamma-glutamylcyclotransferase-like [Halyomorpha halys]
MSRKKLLYFAYCVNMLSSRMECCVDKSCVRKGLGKLEGHVLMFGSYNKVWQGCLPTIVPVKDKSAVVWGALWQVEQCLQPKLDTLQGVASRIYEPIEVDISALRAKGGTFKAISYRLIPEPPVPELYKGKPKMRFRPSKLYLEEMQEGAEESCLPIYYRRYLKTISHNGYTGSVLPDLRTEEEPMY